MSAWEAPPSVSESNAVFAWQPALSSQPSTAPSVPLSPPTPRPLLLGGCGFPGSPHWCTLRTPRIFPACLVLHV